MLTRGAMVIGAAASMVAAPALSRAQTSAAGRTAALAAALLRDDSLAARAAPLGILLGTAADPSQLDADSAYARTVAHECSLLVPENVLKTGYTWANPYSFDFGGADRLFAFATARSMAFRGHTLVWHGSEPAWLSSSIVSAQTARAKLLRQVIEPCVHFRGRVDSWDVVNEPISLADGQPGGLRRSTWQRWLGSDYIALAFTAARQADPKALLVLNEHSIEFDRRDHEDKRNAVLALLQSLRSADVPIDALGIQAHLGGTDHFNPGLFERFLNRISALGLKILITEMDVIDRDLPADRDERDQIVAQSIGDFLAVVLRHPEVTTVASWGLSDRHNWLSYERFARRTDGLPLRPSLLDEDLNRKPAYMAVRTALVDAARLRPLAGGRPYPQPSVVSP